MQCMRELNFIFHFSLLRGVRTFLKAFVLLIICLDIIYVHRFTKKNKKIVTDFSSAENLTNAIQIRYLDHNVISDLSRDLRKSYYLIKILPRPLILGSSL